MAHTSQPILELIPTHLPPGGRLFLTLGVLKVGGRALSAAVDSQMVAQGFREALAQPGRRHGLEGKLESGRPPKGNVQNYEFGWNAGQEAIRFIEQRVGKVGLAPPRQGGRRRAPDKRRDRVRRAA